MSNDLANQSRNVAWITGAYFWEVIDDLKRQMARGTWIFGSGAPAPGLVADGQFYLDVSTGDLYYNAGGTVSVIFNFNSGSSSIVMTSISSAAFPTGVIDTSTLGPQFDLTGKTPDVNFILFTDATLSNRIRFTSTPPFYGFGGTTITLNNGAEDVFLLILS